MFFNASKFLILIFLLSLGRCHLFKNQSASNQSIQSKQRKKIKPDIQVQFINEQILKLPRKTKMGGLSALNFHAPSSKFFALTDDKKNHRIYQFALKKLGRTYQFKLEKQIRLKQASGRHFNMDPEGLIKRGNTFYVSSEGQQIFKKPDPPQIFEFDSNGLRKKSWNTPFVFWDPARVGKYGAQENKGFESLSWNQGSQKLWAATEEPLFQDLKNQKTKWIRLSEFSMKNRKMTEQYAYPLKKLTGLTEIIFLRDKTFLTLDRYFNKKTFDRSISLFLTNCQQASSILDQKQLKKFTPCSKQLLWLSKNQTNLSAENLEGMALGPKIHSQKQLLVLVSDNDFNPRRKTQILFFEFKQSN